MTPDSFGSSHYAGDSGAAYFARQKRFGHFTALWNLPFWEAHISDDDTILDFGCGGGWLLKELAGKKKIGIEINPTAIDHAKSLGLSVYSTIDEVPTGDGFSRVISSHALEHVLAPLATLQALRVRLQKNGKLILLLPLDDWRTSHQRAFRWDDPHHHLYGWTPQNLGNLLVEAGFRPLLVEVRADAFPPIIGVARISLRTSLTRRLLGRFISVLLRRRQLFAVAEAAS